MGIRDALRSKREHLEEELSHHHFRIDEVPVIPPTTASDSTAYIETNFSDMRWSNHPNIKSKLDEIEKN